MIRTKFYNTTKQIIRCFSQTLSRTVDPIQDKSMNESCIVVNENDVATGYASKRKCHTVNENGDILLHRAFSVFIFNSKDELLLQRRSLSKITFPGFVSNACCSHPLYDIDNEREENNALGVRLAAQRRLNFELGIPPEEADINSLHYLTRIHYKSTGDGIWGEHEIDYILILHKDVSVNPNSNEISDIYYVPKNQLDTYLSGLSSPITPWFNFIVKSKRLNQWWNNLHQLNNLTEHDKILRI
ncbi:isopentenyl-diphosphate delta isomerase [Lycorma delicatula]|uniref:isopentenyl-diphosphate delta isomerase n=1 Tax=Lycorma delicatula TaxID=130591 RepID=UPI003F515E33